MHARAERRHSHWQRALRRYHLLTAREGEAPEVPPGALDTQGRRLHRPHAPRPEHGPRVADWEEPEEA